VGVRLALGVALPVAVETREGDDVRVAVGVAVRVVLGLAVDVAVGLAVADSTGVETAVTTVRSVAIAPPPWDGGMMIRTGVGVSVCTGANAISGGSVGVNRRPTDAVGVTVLWGVAVDEGCMSRSGVLIAGISIGAVPMGGIGVGASGSGVAVEPGGASVGDPAGTAGTVVAVKRTGAD
jgi:hypothetical protein